MLQTKSDSQQKDVVWCTDFLLSGGVEGGSCCISDDIWDRDWCKKVILKGLEASLSWYLTFAFSLCGEHSGNLLTCTGQSLG